eukprot:gnl/Chilomastix_caulleri/647.p1 GENE.gnl/Chilomastix_caulleri/647~~gnl/Chilomastix_caulleri/647.p1  ORF type:complete len:251 (-),score=70.51 gnl/Chilomastix_caulleri/647:189-941(-)
MQRKALPNYIPSYVPNYIPNYIPRAFFYGSRIYSGQLEKGQGYNELVPIKVLSFVQGTVDDKMGKVFTIHPLAFGGTDPTPVEHHEPGYNMVELTFIQLGKFAGMDGSGKLKGIDAWASLFGLGVCQSEHTEDNLYKVNPNRYQGDAVVRAINELYYMAMIQREDYERFVGDELRQEREIGDVIETLVEDGVKRRAKEMAKEMVKEMMEERAKEESEKLQTDKVVATTDAKSESPDGIVKKRPPHQHTPQ